MFRYIESIRLDFSNFTEVSVQDGRTLDSPVQLSK